LIFPYQDKTAKGHPQVNRLKSQLQSPKPPQKKGDVSNSAESRSKVLSPIITNEVHPPPTPRTEHVSPRSTTITRLLSNPNLVVLSILAFVLFLWSRRR
jgi:hypothetical protein